MTTEPAPKSSRNRNLAIGCGGLIVLFLLCGIVGNMMPKSSTPATTTGGQSTAVSQAPADTAAPDTAVPPTEAPTAAEPAPAYAEIAAFRKTATDVQWDEYAKSLAGKAAVNWPGLVTEVTKSGDGFDVAVDFDNEPAFSISDGHVRTADAAAASFSKGASVVVNGVIDRVDSPLGLLVVRFKDGATVVAAP